MSALSHEEQEPQDTRFGPQLLEIQEKKPGTTSQRPSHFQQSRMANDPALAAANGMPGGLDLSDNIGDVEKARDGARQADDARWRDHQKKREVFERKVAIKLTKKPEVKDTIQEMCDKAMSYVDMMGADVADLGTDVAKGYGGAVGKDPEAIRKILGAGGDGSIREKMLALQNFQEMIARDQKDPEKKKKLEEAVKKQEDEKKAKEAAGAGPKPGDKQPATFGAADLANVQARLAGVEQDSPGAAEKLPADKLAKAMFSPLRPETAPDGKHGVFAGAKKQDMDTKLPAFLTSEVAKHAPGLAPALPPPKVQPSLVPPEPARPPGQPMFKEKEPGVLPGGEASPLVRSATTVQQAAAEGLELSPREIAAAEQRNFDGGDVEVPWIEGRKANIVDEKAEFIDEATEKLAMPIKAGISGTTFRMMELADMLNVKDKDSARAACVGFLVPVEAHSFHEIATAAGGFTGESYKKEEPYSPGSMKPLTNDELDQIAVESGFAGGLAEANLMPPPQFQDGPKGGAAAPAHAPPADPGAVAPAEPPK